jgi:hypothetical protein
MATFGTGLRPLSLLLLSLGTIWKKEVRAKMATASRMVWLAVWSRRKAALRGPPSFCDGAVVDPGCVLVAVVYWPVTLAWGGRTFTMGPAFPSRKLLH